MKRIIIPLLFILLSGCVQSSIVKEKEPQKLAEKEISDKYWQGLSKDLSKLQSMIEAINRKLERERSALKVHVDSWDYPIGEKMVLMKPSEKMSYPIIKKGRAKIPTKTGFVDSEIYKIQGKDSFKWIAKKAAKDQAKDAFYNMMMGVGPSFVETTDPKISFYAMGVLSGDQQALPAIIQLISFESAIDKAYDEVTDAIKYIQRKYNELPFFMEGFEVNLGWPFSVKLIFKIKK